MLHTITFNSKLRYIILPVFVSSKNSNKRKFMAILDTGAPRTEFSDEALYFAGLLPKTNNEIKIEEGLQTQKYSNIVLPFIEICSHYILDLNVYVSHFDKSWGIDALIGLDFFRRFRVTVDYENSCIVSEPFKKQIQ